MYLNFQGVKDLMDQAVNEHGVPCSEIAISYCGAPVYRYRNGTRDDNAFLHLEGDELYYIYSETKPVTAVAILQLYENKQLDLDDPVSIYLSEYAHMQVKTPSGLRPSVQPITIRHLLTMTSGLNYNCTAPGLIEQAKKHPNSSTRDLVRAIALEPLEFDPGSHFMYSLSHDVLGAVIEIVSGKSLGAYMRQNIFDVCGMNRTGFSNDDSIKASMCSQFLHDLHTHKSYPIPKENSFVFTPAYESGGAGLISCVDDYFRFVTELANGEKLLRRETIDLMRVDHLRPAAFRDFQQCKAPYSYGLGVRTAAGTILPNKGEFGWDGAAGAYCLIDPDRKLAISYFTHVLNHGQYLYSQLHPALRDAVYHAISAL